LIRLGVGRLPLTVALTSVLAAAEVAYELLPDPARRGVLAWASTNVHRLGSEPIGPVLVSAFVVPEHPLTWLALVGLAGGAVEHRLGARRTLVVLTASHVGATLLSEGLLWWRVDRGDLDAAALRAQDVGASYLAVGLLAAATACGSRVTRLLAGGVLALLAIPLLRGLTGGDVAAVGHLCAAGLGAGSAICLADRPVRSPRTESPG